MIKGLNAITFLTTPPAPLPLGRPYRAEALGSSVEEMFLQAKLPALKTPLRALA